MKSVLGTRNLAELAALLVAAGLVYGQSATMVVDPLAPQRMASAALGQSTFAVTGSVLPPIPKQEVSPARQKNPAAKPLESAAKSPVPAKEVIELSPADKYEIIDQNITRGKNGELQGTVTILLSPEI